MNRRMNRRKFLAGLSLAPFAPLIVKIADVVPASGLWGYAERMGYRTYIFGSDAIINSVIDPIVHQCARDLAWQPALISNWVCYKPSYQLELPKGSRIRVRVIDA
jgi:hypothetical protein